MDRMKSDLPAPIDALIACPTCDAVYEAAPADHAKTMACDRCHRVLIAPSRRAGVMVILLALASVGLVAGAVTMPFLSIKPFFLTKEATLIETALAFEGPLLVLSVAVLSLVLLLPVTRLVLTLYVVTPIVAGRPPLPGAKRAFRVAEALKPWSMAEIFALGGGIALIKIVDLAHVSLGPAVWMFGGFVVLMAVQNTLVCRWSLWSALDR